jgi:hypothetical protein
VLDEVVPLIDEDGTIAPIIEIIDEIEESTGIDIIPGGDDITDWF